jgi:hypothetical protein
MRNYYNQVPAFARTLPAQSRLAAAELVFYRLLRI